MGLVGLAQLLHLGLGGADGGVDAGVVAAVVAQDGGLDLGEVGGFGRGAVVDDGGVQGRLRGRVGEAAAAAPAEADRGALAVGGRELDGVVADGVQAGRRVLGGDGAHEL